MSDEENKKIDITEQKEDLDLEEFEVIEDLSEVPSVPQKDTFENEISTEESLALNDDFDDFDDLTDDLAAVSSVNRTAKENAGKGKIVVVGVLVVLLASAGYYFTQSYEVIPPVSQSEVPIQEDITSPVEGGINPEAVIPMSQDKVVPEEDFLLPVPQPDSFDAPSASNDIVLDIKNANANPKDIMDAVEERGEQGFSMNILNQAFDVEGSESSLGRVENIKGVDGVMVVSLEEDLAIDFLEEKEKGLITIPLQDIPNAETVSQGLNGRGESVDLNIQSISKKPIIKDSAVEKIPVHTPDVYFDSVQKTVQQSNSLQSSGPTEVDPTMEPATKYVVVTDMKPKNSIESRVAEARRALKLGRYNTAYEYYESLYKLNPRDESILMGRAVSLQKIGRKHAALNAYEELLALYPENADALVNMLGLVKGQYPAVALQKLLSIRQDNPQNAGVVAQIGLTYATMENYMDAKKYLNIAMGMEPDQPLHIYNLAVIHDREGEREKAIKYYDQALRVDAIHGGGRSINRDSVYDRLSKLR